MSQAIEKYLAKLRDVTSRPGVYAYRGQEDADWPLHSGATRRLVNAIGQAILQNPNFLQTYLSYHRDTLLEPARTQGFGVEGGRNLSDLQLLAKLQHFGAATGLLDFTWNPLFALWIACLSDGQDGKVFAINTNDPIQITKISSDQQEHALESLLSQVQNSPGLSYWQPTSSGDAMARILRQRSVFIIGRPLVPEDVGLVHEVRISKEDKAELLDDLRLLDICHSSVFQDVYGFSQVESWKSPIQEIREPQWHLVQGNRAYQDGNFSNAQRCYSEFINLVPEVGDPYFLRGNAYAASGQYEEAIRDYDQAVKHKDVGFAGWDFPRAAPFGPWALHMVYHNRGNAKESLSDLEGALEDYSLGIETAPKSPNLYFNRGNTLMDLGRLDESICDYDQALVMGHSSALFNKGNALVMLGRFEEALKCYTAMEGHETGAEGATQNRITLEEVVDRIGGRAYEVRIESNPRLGSLLHVQLMVDGHSGADSWNRIFKGREGNIGNYGWKLPGGEGYEGKLGFIVTVEPKP